MKIPGKLLGLIVGFSAFSTMAQKADSVIVIFENQKTTIPLPAFGNQTSVSYADTNKVVEIGVWLRKPGEISLFPQASSKNLTAAKPANTSKWFSQVETGYVLGFEIGDHYWYYIGYNNGIPFYQTQTYSFNDINGYQIMLLLHEKEHYLKKKHSLMSGFKLGYSQSFIDVKSNMAEIDTSGLYNTYDNSFQFKVNSFHFLYQFGLSYTLNAWKIPARFNFGNCMGFSTANIKGISKEKAILDSSGAKFIFFTLLQPYLGTEIGKVGVKVSADLNIWESAYHLRYTDFGTYITFSLTYRIF
jgi:hypothetical protein